MRLQFYIFILLLLGTLSLQAQSDPSTYLDKAIGELEVGNCNGALKWYNVYKELAGDRKTSVEALIEDCVNPPEIVYKLGDQIRVGEDTYTVAYIRDSGKHGLAVSDKGWAAITASSTSTQMYIVQKGIPTFDELKLLYQNRDPVRMYDVYWSCTQDSENSRYYKTMDFSTGVIDSKIGYQPNAIILLIYRF